MYIRESFGWSKGRSNTGEPPSARLSGIRVPLMVALTSQQILKLSVVSPVAVAKEGATEREQHYEIFNKFLEEMVGTLEKRKDRTFVVEEEWPESNKRVQDLIKSKGYRCVHRPTTFVGSFFHQLQIEMRRQKLTEDDPLLPRIADAAKRSTKL
ncbi:hypothetical protein [Parasitella parasitica]|uniref:Uncharacterized protein n=1 Tax=Parasitella parasitica TaxID=35722 RepID=A0A0B7MWQ8_9FUNG|nr:hypothetical protein [Parasitella parasitica]